MDVSMVTEQMLKTMLYLQSRKLSVEMLINDKKMKPWTIY